jgi:hypothetical protein
MELAGLRAEIDRLKAAVLSDDPAVLGAEVLELDRALHELAAEKSRRLTPFDQVEGYRDSGQTSSKAWLRTQTLMPSSQAAAEQNVCRVRNRLPDLFAAWGRGETTFEHVRSVEAVLRKLPAELWPEVDQPITEHARVLVAGEFGDWLRRLAQSLGPEPKSKDETQREMRRLTVSPGLFGMTNVYARLTPEVAEKLHAALSAASRPDVAGEIRLPNQRRADAFEAVLDAVLDAGRLPTEGGQRPHLTISVDLDRIDEQAQLDEEAERRSGATFWTLGEEQRVEHIAAAVADADAATDPRSSGPRYYWTGSASVAATRRLACDGHLLPIFTRDGQPVDVGRRTRVVSPAMRALILARDQHCRWPGCDRPGRWGQIHHVVHWADGGPTDGWNLLLFCDHHHDAAHDGTWTVVLHAPGTVSVRRRTRPDDPLYEIRLDERPASEPDVDTKLRVVADHVRRQRG